MLQRSCRQRRAGDFAFSTAMKTTWEIEMTAAKRSLLVHFGKGNIGGSHVDPNLSYAEVPIANCASRAAPEGRSSAGAGAGPGG